MKRFRVGVYSQDVMVFESRADFDKWVQRNPIEDVESFKKELDMSHGMAGVLCTKDDEAHWFIFLAEKNLVTLCHESCHLAYMMLNMVGVEHTADNHESLAYLQDFVFSECARLLKLPTIFE